MPVSFDEARQILATDRRVGSPGVRKSLPATLAVITRLMKSEELWICNVGPWEHRLERPSISLYVPPYNPEKDAKGLGFAHSTGFPAIHRYSKIVSEDEMGWLEDDGHYVARDLIGIGTGMTGGQTLAAAMQAGASIPLTYRGVFVPEGQKPTHEETQSAEEKLSELIDYLILEARDAYDSGDPRIRRGTIGPDHMWAGRRRGLNEKWLTYTHTEASVRCRKCGKWNPEGIAQCGCGFIINAELYMELEAEQNQILEKATRPKK